jgi:methionyl-tRNA formyltransferase|tara:strand:- start:3237 stop:4253 length:1017 start_codon:yes stop_codon:yes gene_type:complete
MIENNKFFIDKLNTVVFLGASQNFKELIKFNDSINIKSLIITSPHQFKIIPKDPSIKINIIESLDASFKELINKKCDVNKTLFVSLGARYIFKKNTIKNLFLNNLVNFHGTRLPLDSGGGGFSWKIMREDRISNQLVHLIDEGLDTGPVIDNDLSLFPPSCKIPKDFEKYNLKSFTEFYKKFIKKVKENFKFDLKSQINYLGRYNPRLDTIKNGFIDWSVGSYDLINFINAFDSPYPGASTYLDNGDFGKLFLKKVQLHGGDSSNHPFMSGIVTRHDKNWIVVSTAGKHMLLIEEVLNENNENILSKIKPGDRFFTPIDKIKEAKSNRISYSSKGLKS